MGGADGDFSSVKLDDAPDDRQSQSVPSRSVGGVPLIELIENMCLHLRRDTLSLIGYADTRLPAGPVCSTPLTPCAASEADRMRRFGARAAFHARKKAAAGRTAVTYPLRGSAASAILVARRASMFAERAGKMDHSDRGGKR